MEKFDNLMARMTDTHTHIVTMATVNVHAETDRQTHTQTYSSQYFATAPAGEVMKY